MKRPVLALAACFAAGVLDILTTAAAVSIASAEVEANPVARWFIENHGVWGQVPQKAVAIAVCCWVGGAVCRERREGVTLALWVLAAGQTLAAINNLLQLNSL